MPRGPSIFRGGSKICQICWLKNCRRRGRGGMDQKSWKFAKVTLKWMVPSMNVSLKRTIFPPYGWLGQLFFFWNKKISSKFSKPCIINNYSTPQEHQCSVKTGPTQNQNSHLGLATAIVRQALCLIWRRCINFFFSTLPSHQIVQIFKTHFIFIKKN